MVNTARVLRVSDNIYLPQMKLIWMRPNREPLLCSFFQIEFKTFWKHVSVIGHLPTKIMNAKIIGWPRVASSKRLSCVVVA